MLGTEAAPALRKASRKREALEVLGEKAAAASLDLSEGGRERLRLHFGFEGPGKHFLAKSISRPP